jgi:hypothetical protein
MATDIIIDIERLTKTGKWRFIGGENDILGGELYSLKRNYALYCILANTKDDYKVIDESTTISYIPIVEPRGIPMDADKSQGYASLPFEKDPYGRWFPSWVTLKEILEYPYWDMSVLLKKHPDDNEGVRVKYHDRCKEFLDIFIPRLKRLTDQPEHLRIIYHFW